MNFIVRRPEVIDFQWQDILLIFQPEVWFSILGSFVLIVVMYWIGVNWDPRPCTESWSSCILTIFGYFTSTAFYIRVTGGNTRFSLTSWSVFSLIITTILSTGIVTRLTVPLYSPRINTVEQLVKGQFSWSHHSYGSNVQSAAFKETLFDLKDQWIQQFEKRYVYVSEDDIKNTAETDKKMAFIVSTFGHDLVVMETWGLLGYKFLNYYRLSKETIVDAHVSFGVKKQSFLLEPLTNVALMILQVGLMTRWKDDILRKWPQYDMSYLLVEQDIPTFREPQTLPLHKVQPVFLLLLFGLGLATSVFVCEICWHSLIGKICQ